MLINNRYQIIDKLGQGGMGIVYKVHDRLLQQDVALKQVLLPDEQLDFASKAPASDAESLRLALAKEFRTLASLRHPNIVSVLDYGFDAKQQPYFTMTYLENSQTIVAYAQTLPEIVKTALLMQILEALYYLHQRGILHRDLKPDNVHVTQEGQVKVMDFGLASAAEKRTSTQSNSLAGTLLYMPPEYFNGGEASIASDLYAVGIIAYEMLLGHNPYNYNQIGELVMSIMSSIPDTSSLDVPLALWFERLLDKDPTMRPESAYDTLKKLCDATNRPLPPESEAVRESFLQSAIFVGRDDEFTQLQQGLQQAQVGEHVFYLVGGESGVGKSRLVDELRSHALVDGFIVLSGREVVDNGLPFQLWRDIVRRLLFHVDVSDQEARILKHILPDIDSLLSRAVGDVPQDDKLLHEQVIATITDLFKRIQQPCLLILDDLQWSHESLLPLRQLLKQAEQLLHVMVVGTYRDDERPDLPNELSGIQTINLNRLQTEAIAELCTFILGEMSLRSDIIDFVEQHSEGNTFFVVEIMRTMVNNGERLQQIDATNLPDHILTGGMSQIFTQRLKQMPDNYQPLLQLAAIIGRKIDERILHHIYPELDIENWLYLCDALAILQIQDNNWQFIHDKLREFILEDMTDETKQTYHRLVAEAIEATYPDDESYNEILLNHWQKAGNLDKELAYLEVVIESYVLNEDRTSESLGLIQHILPKLPENDKRRVFLLNWKAYVLFWFKRESEHAAQTVEEAYQLAKTHDDDKGIAFSLNQLGSIMSRRRQYQQAKAYYKQSMVHNQKIGYQFGIASNLSELGEVAEELENYQEATDYYKQSLAIREKIDDKRGMSIVITSLGFMARRANKYTEAEAYFSRSLAIAQSINHPRAIAYTLTYLGFTKLEQSDHVAAHDYFAQGLVIFQNIEFHAGVIRCLNGMNHVALASGDYTSIPKRIHESLLLASTLRDTTLILEPLTVTALYHHANDDTIRALHMASFIRSHLLVGSSTQALLDMKLPLSAFEAHLSEAEIETAITYGQTLDLDMLVQDVLQDLSV